MVVKIKNINIKCFRGIVNTDLPLNGSSLLLQGENGTGKSSIVSAIELFFTGEVSTLKGRRDISLLRHGPHVHCDRENVQIDLTFPGDRVLSRTLNSFSDIPLQFKTYFDIAQKGMFILTRKQLLTFIDSTPSERFKVLGDFIGIEALEQVEKEIKNAFNSINNDLKIKDGVFKNKINVISENLGEKINNIDDLLPILNQKLKEKGFPLLDSFEDAPNHSEKLFLYVKKNYEGLDNVLTLKEIGNKTDKKISSDLFKELKLCKENMLRLLDANMDENLSFKEFFESAIDILDIDKENRCPLCDQDINRDSLLIHIQGRLQSLNEISKDVNELKKLFSQIIEKLNNFIKNYDDIYEKMEKYDEFKEIRTKLSKKTDFLIYFIEVLESAKELKGEIKLNEFITEVSEINKILKEINGQCEKLISNSPVTDEEKDFLKSLKILAVSTSEIKNINDLNQELKDIKYRSEIAAKIYNSFLDKKNENIQSIFDSIESDIQNFYHILHPNEPHENIKLNVSGRASAELKITSFGHEDEHPGAFTSEGHLDSLGLCIFLALIKKFNQDCSLLILDDIVTTVDSAHRQMICKLLFENFREKQFIITTHESLWYKQLTYSQQVYGVNFKNCKIIDWSVGYGPELKPYNLRWDYIIDKISSGDLACAGNEGRQYLEWILENVVKSIDVKVSMKERYTVHDLFDPVKVKLNRIIEEEETKNQIDGAFTDLNNLRIMGNLLSHNNLDATNITPTEVRRFVESIHEIKRLLSCPSCNRFLIYRPGIGIVCPKNCSNSTIETIN